MFHKIARVFSVESNPRFLTCLFFCLVIPLSVTILTGSPCPRIRFHVSQKRGIGSLYFFWHGVIPRLPFHRQMPSNLAVSSSVNANSSSSLSPSSTLKSLLFVIKFFKGLTTYFLKIFFHIAYISIHISARVGG